jgi:hypothetical protein
VKTPPKRFFGMSHSKTPNYPKIAKFWDALEIPKKYKNINRVGP